MPRTGTTSPTVDRTEHSDRENSDEEDAVMPNAQHGTGMDDYSERKNDSDSSISGSDGDSSFVGKIRSNFSGMLSVLLPARRRGDGTAPTRKPAERHSSARNIFDEQNEERLSHELRKRPHSPNAVDSDVSSNVSRTYEMIRKRPRLRETDDTKEEKSIRPTSATLRTRTSSFSTSHRLGGLMSNSAYRNRMQQSRSGYVHKTLFGSSHLKSTKDRNNSDASARRPSFNISAAKMSKSLSNGWIPPEYGGSPFYEGLTRYGGASSARTLATKGPSRPAVTVLVKNSHPIGKAQSLPDALVEVNPERDTSAMSYASRRILEIVDEYSARSSSSNREMTRSNTDLRTPRTLQMLNLIRSQQMERTEELEQQPPARPPTVPPAEYTLPMHVDNPTSPIGKDEPKSTGGKQITKKTRLHADPIKERDVATVEPIQLPNLKLPPLLEGLPKFDFTVPMKGPLLVADKEEGKKNTKSMNGEKLPANDENKKQGEMAKNTTVQEIRSFGFTSPMPLNRSAQVTDSVPAAVPTIPTPETSISLFREMTKFIFTSPKLLNGSSQNTSSVPAHRETDTFVFATPIVLGNSTVPIPTATISFEFALPEPLAVPKDAAKVRSFQELMAETATKWACDVCMIRNEPHQEKCIACESPKPATVPAKKKEQFLPAATNTSNPTSGSFAAIVNAQSGRWECPACSVRNEPTASVCVCCATENPTGGTKSNPTSGSFAAIVNAQSSRWECPACSVRNEPTASVCVCCATENSTGGKNSNPTSGSFAAIVNAQSSRWECPACSVRNEPTASVCVCCATANPTGGTK
ncbi:nuclear pore complex protein Nup153-like [Anopheles funestus]|uniref:nuclear pore complex protein Nup153-like n=1 Tax=Anopheles funestus TaxID=62324 RepID=UPI0020C6B48E|nr:nuclear pore complex protein Nup153-like [Anopheles funestus]XP_049281780.1 nuclear pore complex protein Nup153-like [Anopheles funestus]